MTRWVVVTGVAGGIGSAVAAAARHQGYSVLGLDRDQAGQAHCDDFRLVDLEEWRSVGGLLADAVDGREVHALVNNAACQPIASVVELTDGDIEAALAVNVASAVATIRALAGPLGASRGAVVNVSSVHAVSTTAGMSIYAASKAALSALTRGAALDLAARGVRVNAVVPGAVDSGLLHANFEAHGTPVEKGMAQVAAKTPLGRVGTVAEVASVVMFLLDGSLSGFITGQEIVVDGGVSAQLSAE